VQHSPPGQRLLSPAEISCAGHSGCPTDRSAKHRIDPEAALDGQAHFSFHADPDHEANSGGKAGAVEVSLQRFWLRHAV
jgi:hypothetical protein